MDEQQLLQRITVNPSIFAGKPIIRGRRFAVEHLLGMLAAGDSHETILEGYPWLERDDIQACLVFARRMVGQRAHRAVAFRVGTARMKVLLVTCVSAFAKAELRDAGHDVVWMDG